MPKSKTVPPILEEGFVSEKKFARDEYPSPLIAKLCQFYNANPDYPTDIVDISVLCRITSQELNKFISRPHKRVTQIFFDKE